MAETSRARVRDPKRPARIVDAAARLIARDGYTSVSIAEIGAEAGIVGSGVYRHFDSKSAVLVAIFERVIDNLLTSQRQAIDGVDGPAAALRKIVDGQLDFVVGDRAIAQVYYREVLSLPDADRRRLRRKQRRYIEGWVPLVSELHPEASEAELRAIVHAAIGAIHSTLNHESGLAATDLRRVIAASACSVIGMDPVDNQLDRQGDHT